MADKTSNGAVTRDLEVTRLFEASVEQVWKAWSDPVQVVRWWGPEGFTSPLCEMDFHEGGTTLVCMRAPKELGGKDLYNTWTYQKIVPMQRIEFILAFTDKNGVRVDPRALGLAEDIPREVRHVVTLAATGEQKTELTVTEYGYTSDQVFDLSKAGLEQCLDKMAAIFARI